jgi:hypothetical protein
MITKNVFWSWVVFLVLGAGMWFLRYGGGLEGANLKLFITYAPYVLLAIHVILVLLAFQDTVYQGILCLLIPVYTFYWLFIVVDFFFLRAVIAGLLVGIGQDSIAFYQALLLSTADTVKTWIESGG